jgi:hypothetical protein
MAALRNQIEGYEFDWFAIDAEGRVGHFSTAGEGLVPKVVLEHITETESLTQELLRLPVTGKANGHLPGNINDWLEMAGRGVYSFDWQHSNGAYRLAATPSSELQVVGLPEALRASLSMVKFTTLRFRELTEVWPERECPCE